LLFYTKLIAGGESISKSNETVNETVFVMFATIGVVILVLVGMFIVHTYNSFRPETVTSAHPPNGVWRSEEPRIIFYFKPEYLVPIGTPDSRSHTGVSFKPLYPGIYTLDDIDTKVFVEFGRNMTIRCVTDSTRLIEAYYREVREREEIRLVLFSPYYERLGIREIVFRRMEDYDQIDPHYWFPEFFVHSDNS